ncbi:MAG: ferrochelatase [Bacteroidales bacterium]|nr:ferrochelatase [Bacteroidales bacterium]
MTKHSDTALLIINYGTPEKPEKKYVKKFLKELLNSKHVMTMNALGRSLLVNCIIVPFRVKHSLKMYQNLNAKHGMLLKTISESFVQKVQNVLKEKADVYLAMTAGFNLLKDVLKEVTQKNYRRLIIAPMYPQYTESTWGNALDSVYGFFKERFNIPLINTLDVFYDKEPYLESMKKLFEKELLGFDFDRIVFSYHGIPLSHPNSNDYIFQCQETTRLICEKTGIALEKAETSFQSRMSEGWTVPFTDEVVTDLAKEGVKKIAVVAPSFTVDCLETVIELGETLKENFMKNGGTDYKLIPCLNDRDFWVEKFCSLVS